MATIPGDTPLTRDFWTRLLIGAEWLGNATLEEYAVGWWLEEQNIKYMFQANYGAFGRDIYADYQIMYTAPALIWEVQGDKWHGGHEQRIRDRVRASLIEAQGARVIEIWGHDITDGYPGWNVPTYDQFDSILKSALRYHERSRPDI
jgi:hypothetical protein